MEKPEGMNKAELMSYYGYSGRTGRYKLTLRLLRSWFLQLLASFSPISDLAVAFQRARGVEIGSHVFIAPDVHIDLIYPHLLSIEDYASIGVGSKIFTHSNPTYSIYLKKSFYPRKVKPVKIR